MCTDNPQYVDWSTLEITQELKITLDPKCNLITVKNTGNSVCLFDDDPLQPL